MTKQTPTTKPKPGDFIRIKNRKGLWKINATEQVQGGTRITATSLRAYPRIDTTVPASRTTPAFH